ncbi:hypothetical protein GCM10012275_57160 [Longimycelium tulufanense]|uniref:Pyruvate decarboxylase n=1 Tax=Longimycelium tulufanense TaxID=907463 RepID=A0A8J3CI49_9PSEU|nr:thiamine pyrophosphate-dependent enzyme [Longimycelium tulufanense]GGM79119.1 hypothetical protein GCM10012275_57160 [Longimycelium tulufanense]
MQVNKHVYAELLGRRRFADDVVDELDQVGTDVVFGMPAESVNPLVDALRKHERVRFVAVRHEGAGALMASAYAKASGRLGVCLGTAGPGAAHLLLGTYDALVDQVPLLAISGQVPLEQVGRQAFQEIDSVRLFADSCPDNRLITSPAQRVLVRRAVNAALVGRAPSHLACPSTILAAPAPTSRYPRSPTVTAPARTHGPVSEPPAPTPRQVPAAVLWAMERVLPRDTILAVEPELHADPTLFVLASQGRTVISSGLDVSGYALPAAIGAAFAQPTRTVVGITTARLVPDFIPELLTAQRYRMPLLLVCLDDGGHLDIARMAGAGGVDVRNAANLDDLPDLLCIAQRVRGPSVVVTRSPEEHQRSEVQRSEQHTVAHALAMFLAKAGISRAYGRFTDARFLLGNLDTAGFRVCETGHGESAALMASAVGKFAREPALAVAVGPADLLLQVNGVFDAAYDNAPLLLLGVNRGDHVDGAALLGGIAHCARLTEAPESWEDAVAAVRTVVDGGGVAYLEVAPDLLDEESTSCPSWPGSTPRAEVLPSTAAIDRVCAVLSRARRPAILVGRGATGVGEDVAKLATLLGAPIVTTMPGRGVVSDNHPHVAGGIGSSGHRSADSTLRGCDVLLALGVSARGSSAFDLPGRFLLIQVDHDPLRFSATDRPLLPVHGSVRATLKHLLDRLRNRRSSLPSARQAFVRERRAEHLAWLRRTTTLPYRRTAALQPSAIAMSIVDEVGGRSPVVTVDVGLVTFWIYRYFHGDQTFVWTSSFATMGFAVPAAAALAPIADDRPVIAAVGDGGLAITMSELATLAELDHTVIVVVFNNGKLGAIRFEQEIMGWPEHASALYNGDLAEAARAFGIPAWRVTTEPELRAALRVARGHGRPCLIDAVCEPNEVPALGQRGRTTTQTIAFLLALAREAVRAVRGGDPEHEPARFPGRG